VYVVGYYSKVVCNYIMCTYIMHSFTHVFFMFFMFFGVYAPPCVLVHACVHACVHARMCACARVCARVCAREDVCITLFDLYAIEPTLPTGMWYAGCTSMIWIFWANKSAVKTVANNVLPVAAGSPSSEIRNFVGSNSRFSWLAMVYKL